MGRTSVRAAAVVTLAALFTGTATASFGAVPEEVTTPAPAGAEDGRYIVLLKEKPLATYEGGTNGFAPTKPGKGNQLDAHSPNSQKYAAHLKKQQAEVAADAGVTPDTSYSVTVNGFAAQLTGEQVAELSHDKAVLGVFPDETFHPTSSAVPSTEFLGLGSGAAGTGGVWDAVGGTAQAGKGVVVGVIDTGIAPENPSFAGSPLKKKSGTGEPYTVNGDTIVFDKADGGQFRSPITIAQSWNKQNYNTKLVGGQYFAQGATASGFDFSYDYLSPRDGDGHGSHTASTAAGNFGVSTKVEGIDFGKVSGVAPAAKVAMYKACFVGPDVLVTEDDICAGSDLIAAIDKAVEDGVDVINYSIGGGAAATVFGPDDWAFFGAAQAGVYVAVSAGNDGPGASTADHASPWYTTVAASTIPTYEGTVKFPGFTHAGASVSVPFGKEITAPSVFAGDIGIADNASLCYPGSIDPAKAAGHIVVCVRGGNARVEKSDVVKAAGGTGMVLVNSPTGANSLDNDFHSVPTVHMSNVYYSQILGYVQGGTDRPITLVGDNVSGEVTPTPQIAGFSSRGPILADGSDVIKPDVSAPGVAILAATHNGPKDQPTFGFKSGTSMSSPHVAGLGALYLGVHPKASPAEIKSALMTTAYDLVDANGDPATDPFAQGAGHVDPTKYLSPGLLYLNRPQEWAGYIEGATGVDYFDGIDPTDPSNLNIASIGVGALAGSQKITRTVTAAKAGTYTASVDIPGITAEVSPASFSIAAGATQEFTITLTTADAAIGEWATGFLTWTGGDTSVRSPIAVRPVEADVPASVTGTGADGSTEVTFTPGFTGTLDLHAVGLAPENVIIDGDQTTGASTGGTTNVLVDVAAGTELARFALDSSDDSGSDLDLVVYHLVDGTNTYDRVWQSATGSADEAVTIPNPPAGRYVVSADVFSFTQPFTWTATSALVTAGGAGGFAVTPTSMAVQQAQPAQYTASWSGLSAGGYLGVVRYGDSELRTLVFVDVP